MWYIGIWLTDEAKHTEDKEDTMLTNLPVNGDFSITAAFGEVNTSLWKDGHKGVDIVAANKNIYSPCDGTVRVVANDPTGWGYYVSIGDEDGNRHLLCHLAKGSIAVKKGQKVTRRTVIGTMGSTGNSTGVHLHYQVNTAAGVAQDPSRFTHVPNRRGSYKASDYAVDESGALIKATAAHWAQEHYDALVARGVIAGDETSRKWTQFDDRLGEITVGELLALINKAGR